MKHLLSYQFYKKTDDGIVITLLGETIIYPNNMGDAEIRSIKSNLKQLEQVKDKNIFVHIIAISPI